MDVIAKFKEGFSKLYKDMVECEHGFKGAKNNPYHLEGSVWNHTEMVMDEIAKHKDEVDEREYLILQVAGLFHDSGKPYVWTEVEEKGKRYFMGHWNRSFYIANDMMGGNVFGLEDNEVALVSLLVLNHHRRYEATYSNVRSERYTKLLSILSLSDSLGRIHEGHDENENLDELVVDNSKLKNDWDEFRPTVTFLIGPPCVGKSTYIKDAKLKRVLSRDAIVLEVAGTDDYNKAWNTVNQDKVNKVLMDRYRQFVKDELDFTIDMTNMNKKGRKKFTPKDFNTEAIIFATGYDEIMKRNGERENKVIPTYVIDNFIKSMNFGFEEEFSKLNVAYPKRDKNV